MTRRSVNWAFQIRATAWHEAGHAVAAHEMGGWVNHDGITIDTRWYTGIGGEIYDTGWPHDVDLIERFLCIINFAGWQAEHHWHRMGERRLADDDALNMFIHMMRDYPSDPDAEGDDFVTVRTLLQRRPDASDDEIKMVYRAYEHRASEMVRDPRVWSIITAVAKAVYQRGHLSGFLANLIIRRADRAWVKQHPDEPRPQSHWQKIGLGWPLSPTHTVSYGASPKSG
jgi:hypothetical protein